MTIVVDTVITDADPKPSQPNRPDVNSTTALPPGATVGSTTALGKVPKDTAPAAATPAPVQGQAGGEPAGDTGDVVIRAAPAAQEAQAEVTGSPGLDLALEFFAKQGFGADHPAVKLAREGKYEALEAVLAEKKAAGYERYVALAKAEGEATAKAQAARRVEDRKAMTDLCGGEQELNNLLAWASTGISAAEKASFNAMLKAGGVQALGAIALLSARAQEFADKEPANPKAENTISTAASGGHITGVEYGREVQKLAAKFRGLHEGTAEYQALVARRNASRAAGIV